MENINLPLVVHIIDRLPPDGAERLMVDILKNRSDKFRFSVLCLVEGGPLVDELEKIGVSVTIFNKNNKYDIRILFKLVSWLRKNKASVVHTHLFTADTWGRLAAFISRVPCIVNTVHSTNSWKNSLYRFIDQLLSLVSNKVVACSDEVATVLEKSFNISKNKIAIISNGIDFNRFESVNKVIISEIDKYSDNVIKIVVIGRLHPAKGHLDLLKAINILKNSNYKFHVFLVGEGELRQDILEKCVEYRITDYVTLLGQRTDIPEILDKTDIFVMPSHWEGLPMALLEAMAMSMPVIATRVGGIPDVITDGINGFLIDRYNNIELANKIEKLLEDKSIRNLLGIEAKKTVVKNYSAKAASGKYELLYQNYIGNRI